MDYLIIELEAMLIKRGKTSADLIRATGHTPANISRIKNGKIKAIRLKTLLDICVELDCQPGDIIRKVSESELEELALSRARRALGRTMGKETGGDDEPNGVYAVDLSGE